MDNILNIIDTAKKLIANGHEGKALKLIMLLIDEDSLSDDDRNRFLILSNQYERIRQREILNLPYESTEKNRIIFSLLELLTEMESIFFGKDNIVNINLSSNNSEQFKFIYKGVKYYNQKIQMNFWGIGLIILLITFVFGVVVGFTFALIFIITIKDE